MPCGFVLLKKLARDEAADDEASGERCDDEHDICEQEASCEQSSNVVDLHLLESEHGHHNENGEAQEAGGVRQVEEISSNGQPDQEAMEEAKEKAKATHETD